MDFLSSPVHNNYTYETFDDAFFDLPKEMDFELNDDLKDTISYGDSDDLNDGMYGIWNAKHPWSVNNNSSSIYNSNLHLDFIGGDPESAMMVNPNIVIPSGFQFDDDVKISTKEMKEDSSLPLISSFPSFEPKENCKEETSAFVSKKKKKLSLKENFLNTEENNGPINSKNGVRILKPSGSDSGISSPQPKNEHSSARLKNSSKNINMYYQDGQFYPKPAFSYSCLIALALKNSKHGCLPVAEIYNFMCNHFPYFKTAPNGWKNSVRHNLSLNKCFEKIEKPAGCTQRKGCLWALNPTKAAKLEEEVLKCAKKDVTAIKRAMEFPEHLELLERGELKSFYDSEQGEFDDDDDEDLDVNEETDVEEPMVEDDSVDKLSEDEEHESKKPNEPDQYLTSNVSDTNDLPEYDIEVDDTIYEELVGSMKNDKLFALKSTNGVKIGSGKKPKKYFIQVNREGKTSSFQRKSETAIYDHYDINNLLRFENETKLTSNKKAARFNRRDSSNSRIKQIKFKTWN